MDVAGGEQEMSDAVENKHVDVALATLHARLIEHCTLCGGNHNLRWHYGGNT